MAAKVTHDKGSTPTKKNTQSKMSEELPSGLRSPCDEKQDEDTTHKKSLAMQEESIGPLREDLADWLAKTLEIDISGDNFMDVLDSGVYLCDIANVIQRKALECVQEGRCNEEIPKVNLKCRRNAQSGSWFARDNSANFLRWCKAFGMKDDCMFESEDLVAHKSERQVINTLLELARIGYKYGLEPPNIIKIEKEIEKEEEQEEELPETLPPETPPPKPKPPTSARSRPLNLDEEVRKMAAKCKCSEHVKRIREGKYMVFGKAVIIRLLKNRHLMVRVGGGWETLEQYLIKHNPVLTLLKNRHLMVRVGGGWETLEQYLIKHTGLKRLLKNRHLMVRVGGGWETLEQYLIKHNPVLTVEHRRKNSIDFLDGDDFNNNDKFLFIKGQYKTSQ